MKQNEKLLVYLVTGLLVAILGVAVVFGGDGGRNPRPNEGAGAGGAGAGNQSGQPPAVGAPGAGSPSAKEAPGANQAPAQSPSPGAAGPLGLEDILKHDLPGRGQPNPGTAAPAPATGQSGGGPESVLGVPAPGALIREQPLVMSPPTPASTVRDRLGRSERERDYRHVWANRGDTLGSLVQKWCGSVDEYLELARSLNEDLVVLKAGQRITLPWVDDEVVLAAFEARNPKPTGNTAAATGNPAAPALESLAVEPVNATSSSPVAAPAGADFREYTVKAGDALWTIASKHVGKSNAEQFIAKVRELNPGLDVDRLRVDQRIKLPGKPPSTSGH